MFGRNVVKILTTLLFLTYSPPLQQTIQCTHLHVSTPNGTKKRLVWYFDGNVPYFGDKHIPLFIVGTVCAIAVSWFTISLLLIQCLQRRVIYSVSGGLKSSGLSLKLTQVLAEIIIGFEVAIVPAAGRLSGSPISGEA